MITINELAIATEKLKGNRFLIGMRKKNLFVKAALKKNEKRIFKELRRMVK